MKKYPVTYKNKTYEVRWYSSAIFDYVSICEERWIFGIKYFKEIYYMYEYDLKKYLSKIGIYETHPNYYIEQVKGIFFLWEKEKEEKNMSKIIEQNKQTNLKNWDGVI